MTTRTRSVTMLVALTLTLFRVTGGATAPDARVPIPVSRGSERAGAVVQTGPITEISRLPFPAQATISRVLGRDDRAYRAAPVDGGFRFENARHGLRARFSAAGVEVTSEDDRLTLALRAYGYGEALRPVAYAAPQAEANRIVYRRGMVSEWYVNGPLGLEQGFTLQAPPAGRGDGPLTLSITVGGSVAPRLDAGRDGLSFAPSTFRYRGWGLQFRDRPE